MKLWHILLAISLVFLTTGCYANITGKVIDAETGQPIEGAVVLVEWTVTKGMPGMTYHESYKVIEVLTDREGRVTISGVVNPLVDPPDVTIYKKGYVAWNNLFIFPDYRKRKDFKWQNNYVFKLEKFKPEFTYSAHTLFMHGVILSSMATEKKKLMNRAIEWEEYKAREEGRTKTYVKIDGKVVDAETGEPIQGAVALIKGIGIGYGQLDKPLEMVSDKEGLITIEGTYPILANPPSLTIYKGGYVAWNSKIIFPRNENRKDFKWQNGYVFKLEKWKPAYSHGGHITFIQGVTFNAVMSGSKILKEAIKWEKEKALEERQGKK